MPESSANNEFGTVASMCVVNLLWTGGWDSTFRLLSLISSYSCMVQPYYVISRGRPSWRIEVRTMDAIASACRRNPSKYIGTILPTVFVDVDDLAQDQNIKHSLARLNKRTHVGEQFEYLAAYAKQSGINGLELAIENSAVVTYLHDLLCMHLTLGEGPVTGVYVLSDDADNDLKEVFKYFSYPVFDLTKRQMEEAAKEQGFLDLLEMSWFCQRPVGGRHPCGTCPPCQTTIQDGLSRRVGSRGLLRYYARTTALKVLPDALIRVIGLRLRHGRGGREVPVGSRREQPAMAWAHSRPRAVRRQE
jgi:hypothetical protein